jgi:hypothetical protein
MKSRETKSLLVTGGFVLVLMLLIGAGLTQGGPESDYATGPALEQHTPDAQFVQYLEHRARLESGSNGTDCQ